MKIETAAARLVVQLDLQRDRGRGLRKQKSASLRFVENFKKF